MTKGRTPKLHDWQGERLTAQEIAAREGVTVASISARIVRNGSPAKVKTWDGASPCSKCGQRGHYAPTCTGVVSLLDGAGI